MRPVQVVQLGAAPVLATRHWPVEPAPVLPTVVPLAAYTTPLVVPSEQLARVPELEQSGVVVPAARVAAVMVPEPVVEILPATVMLPEVRVRFLPAAMVVSWSRWMAVALVLAMARVAAEAVSKSGAWTEVLAARMPPTVTVEPDSVRMESPMAPPAVNLASLPEVPEPVMPPPTPAQLPTVLQMV